MNIEELRQVTWRAQDAKVSEGSEAAYEEVWATMLRAAEEGLSYVRIPRERIQCHMVGVHRRLKREGFQACLTNQIGTGYYYLEVSW